ncbi:hypothetical protein L6452_20451 [Arctium lappa]|uniref:Uncharacterized protein n=1 Tax=Arctium lappa TaxID=4217 RepID=A0ACB9BAK0_ARCLA|nr:hypothetical protein L6452_20451 [Arctium lappa]
MRSVHGRGLPGCSSHRKGTEAEVWRGGVKVPDGSWRCGGMEKSGSLGMESASDSIVSLYNLRKQRKGRCL